MGPIIIRGLDDAIKKQLAALAKANGHSMEAEVRDILTRAVRKPNIELALLASGKTGRSR